MKETKTERKKRGKEGRKREADLFVGVGALDHDPVVAREMSVEAEQRAAELTRRLSCEKLKRRKRVKDEDEEDEEDERHEAKRMGDERRLQMMRVDHERWELKDERNERWEMRVDYGRWETKYERDERWEKDKRETEQSDWKLGMREGEMGAGEKKKCISESTFEKKTKKKN